MRVLFSFAGGRGHLEPLLPIARAAAAAGHTVAFTGAHTPLRAAAEAGFDVFPLGAAPKLDPPKRLPLQVVDPAREERDLRERFVRRAARARVPAVLELCEEWRPDVLVRDEADFGAAVAAERLGLPRANVLVIASGALVRPDVVAEALDELRAEYGLPPDPELEMLGRQLILAPFPPSFRDPAHPLPTTGHFFRPTEVPSPRPHAGVPIVYFTLGTVFNLESGDLFGRVLAGVAELPVDVVATVGADLDPGELEPLPPHIRVERFVPQSEVLPRSAAVVSHGGSGTVIAALGHGLPQVVIPLGADQPANAARCEALGFGIALDPVAATPAEVRDAVSAILSEPSYRVAAERLRAEIERLPGPTHAVALLERLALERRPVHSAADG